MREDVAVDALRLYCAPGDSAPTEGEEWLPSWREALYFPSAGRWWIKSEADNGSGAITFARMDAPDDLSPDAWRGGQFGQANNLETRYPNLLGQSVLFTADESLRIVSLYLRPVGNPVRIGVGYTANGTRGYLLNNNNTLVLDRSHLNLGAITLYAALNTNLVVQARTVQVAS